MKTRNRREKNRANKHRKISINGMFFFCCLNARKKFPCIGSSPAVRMRPCVGVDLCEWKTVTIVSIAGVCLYNNNERKLVHCTVFAVVIFQ